MKINSYDVGMDSARTSSSYLTRKFSTSYSAGRSEGYETLSDSFNNSLYQSLGSQDEDTTGETTESEASDVHSAMIDAYKSMQSSVLSRINNAASSNRNVTNLRELQHQYIQYLWQVLFGSDKASELSDTLGWNQSVYTGSSADSSGNASFSTITLSLSEETYSSVNETTTFSGQGNVVTEDGREISFSVDYELSSSFTRYSYSQVDFSTMVDPLVLNFTGDVASLSDTKFYFDLDADGEEEEISTLAEGNGYLALDANGDGTINDGSELFGVKSGDGFADLAAYDSDDNGWIDENDDIWQDLRIWVTDGNGREELTSLADNNVGAIYLGNADTDFTLRSGQDMSVNGAIRKSGFFLYEDGSGAGIVNHLDIAN